MNIIIPDIFDEATFRRRTGTNTNNIANAFLSDDYEFRPKPSPIKNIEEDGKRLMYNITHMRDGRISIFPPDDSPISNISFAPGVYEKMQRHITNNSNFDAYLEQTGFFVGKVENDLIDKNRFTWEVNDYIPCSEGNSISPGTTSPTNFLQLSNYLSNNQGDKILCSIHNHPGSITVNPSNKDQDLFSKTNEKYQLACIFAYNKDIDTTKKRPLELGFFQTSHYINNRGTQDFKALRTTNVDNITHNILDIDV